MSDATELDAHICISDTSVRMYGRVIIVQVVAEIKSNCVGRNVEWAPDRRPFTFLVGN